MLGSFLRCSTGAWGCRSAIYALSLWIVGCPAPGTRATSQGTNLAARQNSARDDAARTDTPRSTLETATDAVTTEWNNLVATNGAITLSAGATIAPVCCVMTSLLGAPIGVPVTISLPMPAPFAGESPATIASGAAFTLAGTAPHTITRRPDFAALRQSAPALATDAQRALAIATQRLASLDRARAWSGRSLQLRSSLVRSSSDRALWTVYFNAMRPNNGGPEDSVQVEVHADRGVLETYAGARRERVP